MKYIEVKRPIKHRSIIRPVVGIGSVLSLYGAAPVLGVDAIEISDYAQTASISGR
jgi:hypothetical protein